ncbi:hypothetical protein COU60_04520 [Candidatus Pacearchaeota archaeon CG10_big_fil_rev_8_21_14_0_10_34_76]|nr:MAG: hypothetical protein COU60_04520 [Candidatus Pacearchaeota archaeon CG10_big_fil_rev_8_21_14_0_10_34_76]
MGMTEWGYVEAGNIGSNGRDHSRGDRSNVVYLPSYIRESLEELQDILDGRGVVLEECLGDVKLGQVA